MFAWSVGDVVNAGPPDADGNWVVDSTGDVGDAMVGDGICDDDTGNCTLRAALDEAQAQLAGGADASIVFAASLAGATIALGSSLTVTTAPGTTLTITGPAQPIDRPIISGGGTVQPFGFFGQGGPSTDGSDITLSGLVVTDGYAPIEGGGGIGSYLEAGSLTLDRVTIENSQSVQVNASSGAALAATNPVTIRDSSILTNQAGNITGTEGYGTAISVSSGDLLIERTSIIDNVGINMYGGAIGVNDGVSNVRIVDSVISDNAADQGGAIWCDCGDLELDRVSVVSNTADQHGGIYYESTAEQLTLTNVTIVGNQATTNVNAALYVTGGSAALTNTTITANVGNLAGTGAVFISSPSQITDSIISGNLGSEGDCIIQSPTVDGYNLLSASCALVVAPVINGTVDTSDPSLSPLAAEGLGGRLTGLGDPLPVVTPLGGSPALDAATCAVALDGRALPRPATGCDVGSVEVDHAVPDGRVFTVDTPVDAPDALVADGVCDSIVGGCTLRAAIMEADASDAVATIEFAGAAVGPNPMQLPDSVCTTAVDNSYCGDFDIERASLTIRGVDEPTAPASGNHPVELAALDVSLFEVDGPTFALEDLTIDAAAADSTIIVGAGNTSFSITDTAIMNGRELLVGGAPPSTLELDEVRLDNITDQGFGGGAVRTSRDTSIVNSEIAGGASGAVTSTDGSLDIVGSNFVDNESAVVGYPMIGCTGTCGPLSVVDSSMTSNSSPGTGLVETGDERATIVNSTISDNGPSLGAVVVGAAGLDLAFSTVAFNTAGGSPGRHTGGLNLNAAGPVTIENSIVAENTGVPGALGTPPPPPDDCVGGTDITLVGVNAFPASDPNDCEHTGAVPFSGVALLTTASGEFPSPRGEAAYTGGTIFTDLAPELINVVPAAQCDGDPNPFVRPGAGGAFADQRGLPRPSGNGCEPGAFEYAMVSVGSVTGEDVTDRAEFAVDDLPADLLDQPVVNGEPDATGVGSTSIRSTDLASTPLSQVPLSQVPLGALATDSDVLDSIHLSELPLDSQTYGSDWSAYLVAQGLADLAAQPLNTISLGQVVRATRSTNPDEFGLPGLTLDEVDFSQTPLGSLPVGSLVLGAATLTDIDGRPVADGGTDWCAIITAFSEYTCGPGADVDPATATLVTVNLLGVPLSQVPLSQVPLSQVDLADTPLSQVPLSQVDIAATPLSQVPLSQVLFETSPLSQVPLSQVPLSQVPLSQVPLSQVPLSQVPLSQVDLTQSPLSQVPLSQVFFQGIPLSQVPLSQVPLSQVPLSQVPLSQVPLSQVPLSQVAVEGSPLSQVPLSQVDYATSPLSQVPLSQVANLDRLVDCGAVSCEIGTFGDVVAHIRPGVTLGDLLVSLSGVTDFGVLGDLLEFGGATLGDIALRLTADTDMGTVADLFDATAFGALTLGDLLASMPDGADTGSVGDLVLVDPALDTELANLTLGDFIDIAGAGTEFGSVLLGDLGPDVYGYEPSGVAITLAFILTIFAGLDPSDPLYDVTLGELLAGVLPSSEYPWERLDLDNATPLSLAEAIGIVYTVDLDTELPVDTTVEVSVNIPVGWRLEFGSVRLDGDLPDAIATVGVDFNNVLVTFDDAAPGTLTATVIPPTSLAESDGTVRFRAQTPEFDLLPVTADTALPSVRDAFEPTNNTPAGAVSFGPDPENRLFLTHIGTATDADWYSLDVAVGTKVSAYLGNLPADYDLLLFGPAPTQLRNSPSSSLPPSPDGGLSLIGEDNVVTTQVADDIDTTPPAGYVLYGASTRRGVGDERIDTKALPAGEYLIKVVGYDGASSVKPYSFRVGLVETAVSGECDYVPGPTPTPPPLDAAVTALDATTNTLILTNVSRMARGYADAATAVDAIESFVTTVNADPATYGGVRAAVVTLDDLASYDAWDAAACDPSAANVVVGDIGARIDAIIASHPFVDNVVLVGGDDQIPFARLADATPLSNETDYASDFDGASPLAAALSLGYVLSDNPYGVANPIAIGPREMFVPEIAVGRLVETPGDIATALDNFVEFDGELDASTALSTGYDFLTDGAEAVADELEQPRGPVAQVDRLISDEWTRADLASALDDGPDLASVNAHFDHYRALPADQDTSGRLTDPFVLDDITSGSLDGSVIFSMGCHAGLSVSDISVGGPTDADWAQTFAGEGAVFAGNTGYGYGDDTVVGATEELMRQFATRLDGSLTIGDAMSFAKQRYTADLLVVSPFDEKVVNQVVFYGLPMYRLGDVEPPEPIVNPPAITDPVTGLEAFDTTTADEPQPVSTDSGVYYETGDGYQATPYQPVQPRSTLDVTQDGKEASGALITGLSSTDVGIDPVYVTPTDDVTATNPEANVDGTVFPAVLQSVRSYVDESGRRDQLVIVPGQFLGDPSNTDGSGTQRIFTEVDAKVFYAPPGSTDTSPPIIRSVDAAVTPGAVVFEVEATDDAGIAQVLVLFTNADSPGTWTPVDLVPDGDRWVATVSIASGVEHLDFFVQVVDAAGKVAVSSNKGAYHAADPIVIPEPDPTAPTITLPAPVGGPYQGSVEVQITPGSSGSLTSVTVDGIEPMKPWSSVIVSGAGAHEVVATGPGDIRTRVVFAIAAPEVVSVAATVSPPPEGNNGWHLQAPTMTITATGPDVVSVSTNTNGSTYAETAGTTAAVGPIGDGTTTVGYYATIDPGGNPTSTPARARTVRVDTTPPVVTCPSAPDNRFILNQPGGQITATVSDATSGTATPSVAVQVPTDAAGSFSVPIAVSDRAGNAVVVNCPFDVTYVVDGFFDPVEMGTDVVNRVKAGRAVPLKWRLTDYHGSPVADPSSFERVWFGSGACTGQSQTTDLPSTTTSGLKYQGDGNWQYNLKLAKSMSGCYTLNLDLLGADRALTANLFAF